MKKFIEVITAMKRYCIRVRNRKNFKCYNCKYTKLCDFLYDSPSKLDFQTLRLELMKDYRSKK